MKFIFSAIFLFVFCSAIGQAGTTFWFAVPEVSQNGGTNLDRPIFLRLTAFGAAATVTISQPAGGGMPTQVVPVPANGTVSVNLTTWLAMLENTPANTVLNYGILIQSTAPISAYYDVVSGACLCNPEDFILKGANALGTDFWIPGQKLLDNDLAYVPGPTNSFDIVATQNGTNVTITPSNNIIGHAAGVPFTITLNMGQTYSATASSNLAANHLLGSRVTSNKPIAITEKDDLLNFVSSTTGVPGQDLIGDQIVPVNILGTEYIPMYGNLSPPSDQLFITATQNATTVSVNGTYMATINAGQTYQMTAIVPSCFIQTSLPVYVYQLSGIASEVGSALLPQINCTGSTSVSFNQSSTINFQLNLLVKSAGIGNFLVNGVAGVITAASFTPVTATGGVWYSAQVTLPVSSYPIGSVLTVSNTSDLFQLGFLSSSGGGASFGYFSNYGGIAPNPAAQPDFCVGDTVKLFSDSIATATYSWSGPNGFTSTARTPFIPGAGALDSGIYKVIVGTPLGCVDSGSITVAVHPYPQVHLGNDTLICSGLPLLLQPVSPIYGGIKWLWSNTDTFAATTVTATGTYWLRASNNGCVAFDTIKVRMEPGMSPNFSFVVHNSCTSSAVDFTNLLTGSDSYLWDFGDGTARDTSRLSVSHVYSVQGVYNVKLTRFSGICERDSTIQIDTRHIIHADFMPTPDTICAGESTTLVDASAPASALNSYGWKFGDGSVDNTIGSPVHLFPNPGFFPVSLVIADTLGCKDSVTKGVYVLHLVINSFHDTTLCVSQPFEMMNRVIVEPNIALQDSFIYSWMPGDHLSDITQQIPYYSGLGLTTYTLTATLNRFHCAAFDNITIHSVPGVPLVNVTTNQTIPYGGSVQLNADSAVYYQWRPNDGSLNNANISNPVAKPTVTTIYTVHGYDGNGCADSAFVTIYIDSNMAECIPSAFTPNGDGLNDFFRPACEKFQHLVDFRIFNRWGKQVFYSNSFGSGWDGNLNGEPQDMGVYYYVITVAKPGGSGEDKIYKGDVTLVR